MEGVIPLEQPGLTDCKDYALQFLQVDMEHCFYQSVYHQNPYLHKHTHLSSLQTRSGSG